MEQSKFIDEQIISAIKQHRAGTKTQDIYRKLGIANPPSVSESPCLVVYLRASPIFNFYFSESRIHIILMPRGIG